jgi:hypothetical protein
MKVRKRRKAVPLPLMMMNMTLASWETIVRRTMLIAERKCSQSEYRRMVGEKAQAAMETGLRLALSGGQASITSLMAPWYRRVAANAKRLRRK